MSSAKKVCVRCRDPKSKATDFYKNRARSDGLQNICKSCQKEKGKRHYQENVEASRKKIYARRKKFRDTAREYVLAYLYEHPCVDCGEGNPLCLHFDHVRGKKRMGVSQMVGYGYKVEAIQKEIDKCEVRCANCHSVRTQRAARTWLYRRTKVR